MNDIIARMRNLVHGRETQILTSGGVLGTIGTAYLTGKASWTAAEMIMRKEIEEEREQMPYSFSERFKIVGTLYIPAGVAGALTVAAIIGSHKKGANQAAAAVSAYSITERAFEEYKAKVVEQLGPRKDEKIRDEVAQDRVTATAGSQLIVIPDGKSMCCELYTGRYFNSDMETLRKAVNDLNHEINDCYHVTLNTWYDMIGLGSTSAGNDLGWDSMKMMELQFTTCLSEDGKPCIAFNYNYVKPI